MKRRLLTSAFVLVISSVLNGALPASAAITASAHSDAIPSEIPPPLAAQLKAGGVRAVVDGVTLDFWWSAGVPIGSAAAWADVAEGTLIGALKVSRPFRDIRGKTIKPGVYTLRYGIQPDNGDHLGVSPHRQFLLVSPAALDKNPAPQGHDGTVELSKEAIGGSHPAVLSIDPPAAAQAVLSIHKTDLDHQALIVEVPAVRGGQPAGALKFGIVLVGKIEAAPVP
jgi:hypothetical protein